MLLTATAAVAHRGPDDSGLDVVPFGAYHLGLGHRRLSILDLSPLGHQPMIHPPSGCRIVFNGEIYNFRRLRADLEREGEKFLGGSDTEVLLAGLVRHGEAYLTRLEGMYAFAFHDPRTQALLLARDPAGIKPLYLATIAGGLAFASEVRALTASAVSPQRLDPIGVAGFLAYGAVQQPRTIFAGITSLPPGSRMTVGVGRDGELSKSGPVPFWRFPPARNGIGEAEAVAAVRETLDAAVGDHLIADVPVAVFLSSGLDSTILAGLASRRTRGLNSFTVVLDERGDRGESDRAAETARLFGLNHTHLPQSTTVARETTADWLAAMDQPSIDGLNTFFISRAVRERGFKVALSGLGADELFGGYPSFRDVPRLRRVVRLIRQLPAGLRRGLAGAATVGRSAVVRDKLRDMFSGDGSLRSLYLQRRRVLSDAQLANLGITAAGLGLPRDFLPPDAAPDVDAASDDAVRVLSQLEFRHYEGNMLLRDADANGMAFGLEIRVPFLDRRMLDLAHALPGSIRLPTRAANKYLLRRAFPDFLRDDVLNQPKRGFSLPIGRWMAGDLRPVCEAAIATLANTGVLNPDGVQSVWQGFLAEPESPMWTRAFALVILGSYCERHIPDRGPA